MTTFQIGSGRPLFILPGGKFINATATLKLASQSTQVGKAPIMASQRVA